MGKVYVLLQGSILLSVCGKGGDGGMVSCAGMPVRSTFPVSFRIVSLILFDFQMCSSCRRGKGAGAESGVLFGRL